MKVDVTNNTYKKNSPNFGRVVKFKNNFTTYNDVFKEDYLKFIDTFKKSEPIKEYCSKHKVIVEFLEDGFNFPELSVIIRDLRLNTNITWDNILTLKGKGVWTKVPNQSPFEILTQKILNLKPKDLEENFVKAKTYGDNEIAERAKTLHVQQFKDAYSKKLDQEIDSAINEIKGW